MGPAHKGPGGPTRARPPRAQGGPQGPDPRGPRGPHKGRAHEGLLYTYIYIYVYIYIYIMSLCFCHMYIMHIPVYTYIYMYIYTDTYHGCVYIYLYIDMYVYVYMCMLWRPTIAAPSPLRDLKHGWLVLARRGPCLAGPWPALVPALPGLLLPHRAMYDHLSILVYPLWVAPPDGSGRYTLAMVQLPIYELQNLTFWTLVYYLLGERSPRRHFSGF